MITVEFLITSLIVVLIPGTGVVFTVSTGLARGRRASVFAAAGCTAGIVPHLLATVLGLAALMHTSAVAFQMLKYAGVAYLLYLAYATWNDRSTFAIEEAPSKSSATRLIVKAFLMNILNPKLTIFFLAFLPQFIEHADIVTSRPASPAECCVHGNDFCSLRCIWGVGPRIPSSGYRITACSGVAAPWVRGDICRSGNPTRTFREVRTGKPCWVKFHH